MKPINYSFTDSDVKTILFTLTILPSLGLEDTEEQADINYRCCCSAGEKLIKHKKDITADEFRVILASLEIAQLINKGEIEVDKETRKECGGYLFSINKLVSVFGKLLT